MTKLLISKATEAKAVATIWNMARESLDPGNYEYLERAIKRLCETRNINNEMIAEEHKMLSQSRAHASDCKTSDAPAMIPGPCDC